MPRLDFWYEFASTYSYLSAMRIDAAAAATGVEVVWRPFLLGPIFQAQGWATSPFNLYPAKGRYMVRDIERIAAARGLVFRLPDPFPQNGLLAARLSLAGAAEGWTADFGRAVFHAEFADGRDISDRTVLADLLTGLGIDPERAFAAAATDEIRTELRRTTATAAELGLFGAPSFVVADGELFWGDDRLDDALIWARNTRT